MEKTLLIEILLTLTFFLIAGYLGHRAILANTNNAKALLIVSALLLIFLPLALATNVRGTPAYLPQDIETIYVYNVLVDEVHGQMFLTARRKNLGGLTLYGVPLDKGLAEKIQRMLQGGEMFVPIEGDYSDQSGGFEYHIAPYTEDPPKTGETE